VRAANHLLLAVVGLTVCGSVCAPACAQAPADALASGPIDGYQVVARIDDQVVLGCEVLWQVNQMIEANRDRFPANQEAEVRQELTKRTIASLVDTKLLYGEFRRSVPAENWPKIEENLDKPFEEREIPNLMKTMQVDNRRELEQKLIEMGTSLTDARRRFNERVIASEWLRSKVKIDEEVDPRDMLDYYHEHQAEFQYPTQARYEEVTIRKDRFTSPCGAYAELARLGNQLWRTAAGAKPEQPVFAEVAKAHSDGFNAKQGGVHDWTTQGALKAAAIDQALFSLPVGQMSPILESDDGFYIVRVLERKQAGCTPFTEVQAQIRDKLKQERYRAGVEEYLAKLHQDARIWTVFTGPVSADVLMGRAPGDTQER
jgi:hypothetical protein